MKSFENQNFLLNETKECYQIELKLEDVQACMEHPQCTLTALTIRTLKVLT
jgi:hypothetical protein